MMEKSLVNTGSLQNRIVNSIETSSNRDIRKVDNFKLRHTQIETISKGRQI